MVAVLCHLHAVLVFVFVAALLCYKLACADLHVAEDKRG